MVLKHGRTFTKLMDFSAFYLNTLFQYVVLSAHTRFNSIFNPVTHKPASLAQTYSFSSKLAYLLTSLTASLKSLKDTSKSCSKSNLMIYLSDSSPFPDKHFCPPVDHRIREGRAPDYFANQIPPLT